MTGKPPTPQGISALLRKAGHRCRVLLWHLSVRLQDRKRYDLIARAGRWLWCRNAPLGRCQHCDAPTWNPVTFQVKQRCGWSGHYFCEDHGPGMLAAARALGDEVRADR